MVWDSLHRPDPELPFPNDAATRLEVDSPTGRRLNLSTVVHLAAERRLRQQLNRLDGFSVFGPITVSFDRPLDLATVNDDTVRVVDLTPTSPEFGQRIPLDLGRGGVPTSFDPRDLHSYDPKGDRPDLLFGDDNTVDGVRVEHYEVATHTLIIRPLLPLRQRSRYGVVLGSGLKGTDGQSVRSPFPGVNHAAQTQALSAVPLGDDVAFAWTFTTQSVTRGLEGVRDGLDGKGQLAWLASQPLTFKSITDVGFEPLGEPGGATDRYALDPTRLQQILEPFAFVGYGVEQVSFDHVAYFVYGMLDGPDLRSPGSVFPGSTATRADVPFALAVPRTTERFKPPFPVVLYSHGARTSRFEMMLIANELTQHGLAVMTIDAVGHGPFPGELEPILELQAADFPPEIVLAIAQAVAQTVLGADYDVTGKTLHDIFTDLGDNGLFRTFFVEGRSKDLDGDGVLYSGDSYFVPNPFDIAAAGQQTLVDTLGVLRLLRRLGPVPAGDASAARLAGDFNGDGVLDVGGPDNRYYAAGTSLGGIHTSVLMAVEPSLVAGVPIVSGGGMTDVLVRTTLATAVRPVLAETIGPVVVGCPDLGGVSLSWDHQADGCSASSFIERAEVARAPHAPGGTVTLENPRLVALGAPEAVDVATIAPDGGFGVAVGADAGEPLTLTVRDAAGEVVGDPVTLAALHDGLGRKRNTPRMRRVLQIAQLALDAADPIAWARHLLREPFGKKVNVLHLTDVGDRTVPFASMVAWDRAVGLHGLEWPAAYELTAELVNRDVLARPGGWDIDDLEGGGDGWGLLPSIDTGHGVAAVRHAPVSRHEFIGITDPGAAFDWGSYFRRQLAWYLATDGQELIDDICFEDGSCAWLP